MSSNTVTLSSTFVALRHRNFRLWFFGQLVSLVGGWMQTTAQGYLVYTLTQSTAYLGYISLLAGLPSWLLIVYSGVIADRVSRRSLMLATQGVMMALAFVLAALVFLDAVQPWHILVLSFLTGSARAFELPARQSIVADLVDREDLSNAIALNTVMFNIGMVIGPVIAGIIYSITGPAWCFTINGFSFLAFIAALLLLRLKTNRPPVGRSSALAAFTEGVRFVRAQPLIGTLFLAVLVYNLVDHGLITLIPVWAVSILGGDATTNGLLLSANGAGAVIGGLLVAALSLRLGRGRMLTACSVAAPVVIASFALARPLPLALMMMAAVPLVIIIITNNSNALVQTSIPDELRGRVMSLYSLIQMSGGPLSSLLVVMLADRVGSSQAVLFWAVLLFLFAVWIWLRKPLIRALR